MTPQRKHQPSPLQWLSAFRSNERKLPHGTAELAAVCHQAKNHLAEIVTGVETATLISIKFGTEH